MQNDRQIKYERVFDFLINFPVETLALVLTLKYQLVQFFGDSEGMLIG